MTQLSLKKNLPPGPHEVFVPEKEFKSKKSPGLSNTWTTKIDTKGRDATGSAEVKSFLA